MHHKLLLVLIIAACAPAYAQVNLGGMPMNGQDPLLPAPLTLQIPPINISQALLEDSNTPGQNRFAAPVMVDIQPETAGAWTPVSDGKLWQCALHAKGALGTVLMFDVFDLPPGSRFFVYTPDRKQILGAFSSESCTNSGKFLIGVVKGETAILEYFEPTNAKKRGTFHLNRIDYAYDAQALKAGAEITGFGLSKPCNINVNCVQGNAWQTEKKGVARILMVFSNGSGWCSGSLIANTSGSYDPYFLTAHHCQLIGLTPEFDLWRFDFDYESTNCANPATEPQPNSVLGCERISYRAETDFMLLKINPIPLNINIYFNGWTRSNTPAANTAFVHHPVGDIKKISIDTSAPGIHPNTINWGGVFGISPANTHWRAVPDFGIYQPGSSGCPLFDPNKRIVGQLHGGNTNMVDECQVLDTYWGRFDLSWNQGTSAQARLKDWLDPANTNANTQNGYIRNLPAAYKISGNVKAFWGTPIANVQVILSGALLDTTVTDTSGNFSFSMAPAGGNYTISCKRDSSALNGVSTYDQVLTSRHILNIQAIDSPWKMIAADVNRSNSITNFDIIESRRLLLGYYNNYPSSPSWRFYPAFISFINPQQPFNNPLPEIITINNLQSDYSSANFIAVKVGDVNLSADPNK